MSFQDEIPASLKNEAHPPTSHEVSVTRVVNGTATNMQDHVVEETPVALVYDGEPHVVMLATPSDLGDFALGFSLTEGIVHNPDEIGYLDITPCESGIQIHIRTDRGSTDDPDLRRRNLTGRTGCGLCGTALIEEAVRNTPEVKTQPTISTGVIFDALRRLAGHQPINATTGAIHAAAWVNEKGDILLLREDVGRHNALDKLVGAMYLDKAIDLKSGFAIVTSRASYEMVTKAAFAGIAILVAISAPTSLAIRIAEKSNITLAGFARNNSCVIYCHPERLLLD
jgi:FdhD protein